MTRSRGDVNKTAALKSPLSAADNTGAHRFVWHENGHSLLDAMLTPSTAPVSPSAWRRLPSAIRTSVADFGTL
jgi:hypothetical protein